MPIEYLADPTPQGMMYYKMETPLELAIAERWRELDCGCSHGKFERENIILPRILEMFDRLPVYRGQIWHTYTKVVNHGYPKPYKPYYENHPFYKDRAVELGIDK